MVTMAPAPAPIQTMKMGPSAVLGRAFSTTRYGSKMRAAVSDHHMRMAAAVPSRVPAVKPSTVSRHDTPMWCSSWPERHSDQNVAAMRLGQLTRKPSDRPVRQLSSQKPNRPMSSASCQMRTRRFCRRTPAR